MFVFFTCRTLQSAKISFRLVLTVQRFSALQRQHPKNVSRKRKPAAERFKDLILTHNYRATGHTSLARGHSDQTRAPTGEAAVFHMSLTCRERPG